jgi:hypothetical protein
VDFTASVQPLSIVQPRDATVGWMTGIQRRCWLFVVLSAEWTVYRNSTGYFRRAIIHRVPCTLALSDTVPPLPPSFTRTKKLLPALRVTW